MADNSMTWEAYYEELDPVRHKKLFHFLNNLTAQTFLTTTSRSHIHIDSVGRIFHVSDGSICDEF